MSKHTAKHFTTDFSNNLKNVGSVIRKMQEQDGISVHDLQSLKETQKKMTVSARAYFNDLGVKPDVLRLIMPLMDGKFENVDDPNFMKTIEQFQKDFTKVTNDIKKELDSGNGEKLIQMYPALKSEKDIKSLKIKIGAIQSDFNSELKKNKQK